MQTRVAMNFKIKSRYFDAVTGEQFDELESSANGCLLLRDGTSRILYREENEGQQILTEISFKDKNVLTLKKSGAAKYELTFERWYDQAMFFYALNRMFKSRTLPTDQEEIATV